MFGQNRVIFVTVSQAISFHQWFMQGCDCNCCTFSLRGRGVGVRQISSLEAYRLMLPPLPHPPPLRRDLIKDRLNFSLFVNLGIFSRGMFFGLQIVCSNFFRSMPSCCLV